MRRMRRAATRAPRASYTAWCEMGADLGPDRLGHGVGRDVGLSRHRAQDRQALRRHLETVLSEEISRCEGHDSTSYQIID